MLCSPTLKRSVPATRAERLWLAGAPAGYDPESNMLSHRHLSILAPRTRPDRSCRFATSEYAHPVSHPCLLACRSHAPVAPAATLSARRRSIAAIPPSKIRSVRSTRCTSPKTAVSPASSALPESHRVRAACSEPLPAASRPLALAHPACSTERRGPLPAAPSIASEYSLNRSIPNPSVTVQSWSPKTLPIIWSPSQWLFPYPCRPTASTATNWTS